MGEKFIKITKELYAEIREKREHVVDYLLPDVKCCLDDLLKGLDNVLSTRMVGCDSPEEQILAGALELYGLSRSIGFTIDYMPHPSTTIDSETYIFDFVIAVTHNKTQRRIDFAVNMGKTYTLSDFRRFRANDIVIVNVAKQDIRKNAIRCVAYIQQIIENVFDI